MRELISKLVKEYLSPYRKKIVDLENRIEEIERRQQGQIRLGVVEQIHESGMMIRVRHGALLSPFIRWFAVAAGETTDYRCPSIGEQCVLLNYGGGNAGSQTIALIGLFSDKFPAPTTDTNLIIRCYPDGSLSSYNLESKVMTVKSVGDLVVDVGGDAKVTVGKDASIDVIGKTAITSGGDATVDAPNIKLNGGKGVVTGDHICMVTGKPHGDCSSTVTAGK